MLKKRYLFLIILVCLFAVSAVSAEEMSNETNMLSNDYDSSLTAESVDENILTDSYGTFDELQNEIDAVDENGTLNLIKNYKYDLNSDNEIKISKSLTINGNNHIIDGNNQSRIFFVGASDVIIKDVAFMNSNGSAIQGEGYISISNCKFINNAAIHGGAINVGYWHKVNLTDCKFINNVAYEGGAIYSSGNNVILNNCEFINNSATFMFGGAIYGASGLKINDCKFNSNSALLAGGGAIYSFGTLRLNNSEFINNIASYGGAIYSENPGQLFNNCIFNNNSARSSGGAIYVFGDSYNNITSCEFNNNSAPNGGAILLKGGGASFVECIIKDTSFKNNYGDIGSSISILEANYGLVQTQILDSYFYNTKNKEFICSENLAFSLFLKNNTMISPNPYTIYSKVTPDIISSKKYLILENETCYVNKPFKIAFTDDNGNKIRLNEDIPITLTDLDNYYFEISAKFDSTNGFYNTSCDQSGTYILSLNPEFSSNVTIIPEILEVNSYIEVSAPYVTKYYGGPERFVVTLTDGDNPLPDKTISITINGRTYSRTTDENGMASLGLNLISGEYDVVVNYEDINVTSKVTVLSTVNGNDLVKMYNNDTHYYATFLDLSGNYLSKGTLVTFNLNGIFYSEKIIDNKGTAKLDINEQPGEYILTAVNPVTGEHAVNTIIVLSNIVENHDLIKYYNESTKFSVRVLSSAGNPASGEKVKFSIRDNVYEATSNSNGYAFLDAVLQPGKYVVTTSYNGLDVNNTIVILPTLADNDMKVSSSDIYEGENEVIKVVLPKDATGKVSTTINGKEYSANVNNGAANIIVSGLNYGNYETEVIYSGDSHYNSVKNKTSFMVDKAVDLSAPDVTKYYGGPERFIVTLNDLNGKPISNAQIKITINGRTSDKTTDDNGIASMGINLNSGEYITTTEYDGIKVNSTVTVKDTVIAKDFTKIFKNGTQYQGTFVDSKGNLIKSTDVKININGVFYTRATNSNGVAQMNINLPPGTYILTATNPLSGEQHTTKVTVLPNIVENYDLTKYYKNASQYSLRLLDDKGNPVGAGVSIQLNINGIFYTKTSDANGYVKMNINLPPGTYIITAEYKGLRASNTIKVLFVLETKDLNMKFRDGSKFEAKVLDGQGNPYAGQTVTFNINGVFYTKTTDADGIARLNINLPAGTYIITSMYNGLNAANNVKIASDSNDEIFYIDLPFQDDIDMIFQKGKYKVNVCQWRIPIRCALNIILYDLNDNIISKFDYYSYYFYEGAWHEITVNDMGGNYHKWSFPPDAHITKVAVKLKDASWY